MVTQPFILHSHKKTILVAKIIIIFRNSTHHHLQTTSKDAKSVMLSYFCLLQSLFYFIYYKYSIQRYFLFFYSYFPLKCNLSERVSPHLSQQEFFSPRASLYGIVGKHLFNVLGLISKEPPDLSKETTFTSHPKMLNPVSVPRICFV